MFEAVVPVPNLSFVHSVITKGFLDFLDDLNMSITKLLIKLDAIFLHDNENPTSMLYLSVL